MKSIVNDLNSRYVVEGKYYIIVILVFLNRTIVSC